MGIFDAFARKKEPERRAKRIAFTAPSARPVEQMSGLLNIPFGDKILRPSPYFDSTIFTLYKFLRDMMPDIGAGVWAWVCLCSTKHWVELLSSTPPPVPPVRPYTPPPAAPAPRAGGGGFGGRADDPPPAPRPAPAPTAAPYRPSREDAAKMAEYQAKLIEYNRQLAEYNAEMAKASQIISELDRRVFPFKHQKDSGMDAVLERFFRSVFTYGAFSAEIVLSRRRNQITKVNFIDPSTIRFKRKEGSFELIPYQVPVGFDASVMSLQSMIDSGQVIELNPNTFYYYGLGADNDNPYGTSLLSSIPFVARIQNKMMGDMQATMHNAGYPRYHIKYTPPKQNIGESNADYRTRVEGNFSTLETEFNEVPPDANFISYDNVTVQVLDAAGKVSIEWYNNHRAVTEQIISGMKLAPFMIGKNYGTTETWGTAQYDLMIRNARMVQRAAKRFAEWIRNLELMLAGSPVRSEHHFNENRVAGEQIEAQARNINVKTTMNLLDEGIISQDQAARELGYVKPFLSGPNEQRLSVKAKYKVLQEVEVDTI